MAQFKTIEDKKSGNIAFVTVDDENNVYVRYINPYATGNDDDIEVEVIESLLEDVQKWINGKNSSKAHKNNPLNLHMY